MRKCPTGTIRSYSRYPIQHRDLYITDTFVILSKTSFSIIGLNFIRNHQAVIDTTIGTITFPHVVMTLAMTIEMRNCNPKQLQVLTDGNQTLQPPQTTTVNAVVIISNTNDTTGAIKLQPQFDETATSIVAPTTGESKLEWPF